MHSRDNDAGTASQIIDLSPYRYRYRYMTVWCDRNGEVHETDCSLNDGRGDPGADLRTHTHRCGALHRQSQQALIVELSPLGLRGV
jgi:hypothetical protein